MADALDTEALRRDRQRYQGLLEQVKQQIATWNERAEHLQTIIGGLDHLLAPAGGDGAESAGAATPSRRYPTAGPAEGPAPAPGRAAGFEATAHAAWAPPPAATPAAPEPVEPPSGSTADAPRGTDAVRLVLEGEPHRAWSLPELLEALGARGWLPTSRRPEEGVRISLKRLAERGGAIRTDDARWRLTEKVPPTPEPEGDERWPDADPPRAGDAPDAEAGPAAGEPSRPAPPAPPPVPRPASFARPVGGTVTEL